MKTLTRWVSYHNGNLGTPFTSACVDRESYIRQEIDRYQQNRSGGCVQIYVMILPHITWQRYNFYILLQNIDNQKHVT